MRLTLLRSALVVAGAVAVVGCAGGGAQGGDVVPAPAEGSLDDLEALYRARKDSTLLRVSEADVAFMTGMIAHHAQALVMSALAPTNGASPTIRTLTARITNAQADEIRNMQAWLRDRGRPVPEVDASGAVHMMHGPDHSMHMPGMLSPGQLQELSEARGPDFDRLFLTYMIQHHQGAVGMVHDLFAVDGAAQDDLIFKIASDIQVDQITEIDRMQRMLDQMTAGAPR